MRIKRFDPVKSFLIPCFPLSILACQFSVLLFALGALLFVVCLPSQAQPIKRAPRIGFLSPSSANQRRTERESFWEGMHQLGYVEGQNISVEYRYAEGKFERLPEFATELVKLKVDVIVAHTTPGSLAAKGATATIPIVITNAGDPVGSGLVSSLARPGGNVTGLSMLNTELGGKRIELLKEIVPSLSRVFVVWNPANHGNVMIMKKSEAVAQALNVLLQSIEVQTPRELNSRFQKISSGRGTALNVIEDPVTLDQRREIAQFAAAHSLPGIYGFSQFVDAGGLISYGIHIEDLFNRAATYVDRILKGTKPADLPVEQPTKFELVVNLKAAKQIDLIIPPNVLARADRVIR